MLTKADVEILRAPFKPEEIDFLRGYAYVREQAVNNRLSEVDPSWSMHISAWEYRADNHVVVMGSMTLNEATRYGIGEQLNDPSKDGKVKTVDCAKGAATDLLKRLARLFFVGLYLTELPDEVKTPEAYAAWYKRNYGLGTPQTAKERAIQWVNANRLDGSKVAMPTDDNNEVAWKTWCEQVKAKAS
jgi:hypothetical protein